MFLRTENSKRVNIFQHFLYALSRARFNLPLYLVPRSSTATTANLVPPKPRKSALGTRLSTARVGSGHKNKTDPTEFYGVGLD